LEKQKVKIPSFELIHDGQPVDFIIKHTQVAQNIHGYNEEVPHRHNYFTILWPIEMKGRHIIDYKEYLIKPNDIFFVSPEQVHQVFLEEKCDGILLLFTYTFLDRHFINREFISNLGLFSEISENPPIHIDDNTASALKNMTDEIFKAFCSADNYKFERIGAYLKLFLIECNKFAPVLNFDNPQTLQSAKSILRKFKDLLEIYFKTWRQVNNYAKELRISPDYLNTVIKTSIGKTAKEQIQQRIILESKRLGLHTKMSTKEIAYELGFDDPSHFSKFFKTCEGQNFSDFRQSIDNFFI
jgi:AraC family transcriptional activator of pobA